MSEKTIFVCDFPGCARKAHPSPLTLPWKHHPRACAEAEAWIAAAQFHLCPEHMQSNLQVCLKEFIVECCKTDTDTNVWLAVLRMILPDVDPGTLKQVEW